MRRSFMVAAGAAFLLLGARAADAKDMNGRVGLGGARTLGGVEGLDVMYWIGRIAIDGTAGLSLSFPSVGDSGVGLSLAGGVLFQIFGGESADLSFGGRVNIGTAHGADTQFTLEAPLRLEWYAAEHFSFHGEVGIAIEIIGDRGRVLAGAGSLASGGGTSFIVGGTFLTAGGGFNVYF